MDDLERLQADLLAQVTAAADLATLEAVRVAALGKKGAITAHMKTLGRLDPAARKETGQRLNHIKQAVADAVEHRRNALEEAALEARLTAERVDITLPPRPETPGRVHPVSQVMEEIVALFAAMGFQVAEGPDIEDDFHNFTALNIPPEHPARQMHDTFYLTEQQGTHPVLRTHTSPVQIRAMQATQPPLRIIAPGRTYRCDSDMTHTPMFHQVEGLVVDEVTHMGHLKGCLTDFVRTFFELDQVPVRFRPSFFPFTEPSAEMDIGCSREEGTLKLGGGDDWLEILGCGMVHPAVLSACGIDPERYQGFAFGMGVERVAGLKYGMPDLRAYFDADVRWLGHYGFRALDLPTLTGGLAR